jgi:hypothetical protein
MEHELNEYVTELTGEEIGNHNNVNDIDTYEPLYKS